MTSNIEEAFSNSDTFNDFVGDRRVLQSMSEIFSDMETQEFDANACPIDEMLIDLINVGDISLDIWEDIFVKFSSQLFPTAGTPSHNVYDIKHQFKHSNEKDENGQFFNRRNTHVKLNGSVKLPGYQPEIVPGERRHENLPQKFQSIDLLGPVTILVKACIYYSRVGKLTKADLLCGYEKVKVEYVKNIIGSLGAKEDCVYITNRAEEERARATFFAMACAVNGAGSSVASDWVLANAKNEVQLVEYEDWALAEGCYNALAQIGYIYKCSGGGGAWVAAVLSAVHSCIKVKCHGQEGSVWRDIYVKCSYNKPYGIYYYQHDGGDWCGMPVPKNRGGFRSIFVSIAFMSMAAVWVSAPTTEIGGDVSHIVHFGRTENVFEDAWVDRGDISSGNEKLMKEKMLNYAPNMCTDLAQTLVMNFAMSVENAQELVYALNIKLETAMRGTVSDFNKPLIHPFLTIDPTGLITRFSKNLGTIQGGMGPLGLPGQTVLVRAGDFIADSYEDMGMFYLCRIKLPDMRRVPWLLHLYAMDPDQEGQSLKHVRLLTFNSDLHNVGKAVNVGPGGVPLRDMTWCTPNCRLGFPSECGSMNSSVLIAVDTNDFSNPSEFYPYGLETYMPDFGGLANGVTEWTIGRAVHAGLSEIDTGVMPNQSLRVPGTLLQCIKTCFANPNWRAISPGQWQLAYKDTVYGCDDIVQVCSDHPRSRYCRKGSPNDDAVSLKQIVIHDGGADDRGVVGSNMNMGTPHTSRLPVMANKNKAGLPNKVAFSIINGSDDQGDVEPDPAAPVQQTVEDNGDDEPENPPQTIPVHQMYVKTIGDHLNENHDDDNRINTVLENIKEVPNGLIETGNSVGQAQAYLAQLNGFMSDLLKVEEDDKDTAVGIVESFVKTVCMSVGAWDVPEDTMLDTVQANCVGKMPSGLSPRVINLFRESVRLAEEVRRLVRQADNLKAAAAAASSPSPAPAPAASSGSNLIVVHHSVINQEDAIAYGGRSLSSDLKDVDSNTCRAGITNCYLYRKDDHEPDAADGYSVREYDCRSNMPTATYLLHNIAEKLVEGPGALDDPIFFKTVNSKFIDLIAAYNGDETALKISHPDGTTIEPWRSTAAYILSLLYCQGGQELRLDINDNDPNFMLRKAKALCLSGGPTRFMNDPVLGDNWEVFASLYTHSVDSGLPINITRDVINNCAVSPERETRVTDFVPELLEMKWESIREVIEGVKIYDTMLMPSIALKYLFLYMSEERLIPMTSVEDETRSLMTPASKAAFYATQYNKIFDKEVGTHRTMVIPNNYQIAVNYVIYLLRMNVESPGTHNVLGCVRWICAFWSRCLYASMSLSGLMGKLGYPSFNIAHSNNLGPIHYYNDKYVSYIESAVIFALGKSDDCDTLYDLDEEDIRKWSCFSFENGSDAVNRLISEEEGYATLLAQRADS